MRVRITGAAKSTYWYSRKIGEVFEVKHTADDPDNYKVINSSEYSYHMIYRDDCEILAAHHPLPTDAKERKDVPIYSGVLRYFPRALATVAELSRIGNEQHNPGKPLHWDRSKSGDELDALSRHLLEAGTVDSDGVRHSTKVAWRALANLEKELENAS